MARQLICLLNTEGKSPEQLAKELYQSVKKYQKIYKEEKEKAEKHHPHQVVRRVHAPR